jgi:hypothetical protein
MNLLKIVAPILGLTLVQAAVAKEANIQNVLSVSGCAQGPYGGVVDCHWRVGANLERKHNFQGAQVEYQQALTVSQNLQNPTLRDCATLSSQARVAAMNAVETYFQKNGTGPEAIGVAHDISRLVFVQSLEKAIHDRPDLSNKCP